jgi:hypothetical protein
MPTFLGRRYARPPEAVGCTEKAVGAFVLLLMAGIVVALGIHVATNRDYLFAVDERGAARPEEPASVFPELRLEGWRPLARGEHFSADDLYVKIDGRADAYLGFHVVGLTFGAYAHASDPGRTVDVYWYDMGTPANAEAVYRSEAAPGATAVPLGAAGYQVGGALFFWKGSSYVQVLPGQPDDAGGQVALKIAERLAERIP